MVPVHFTIVTNVVLAFIPFALAIYLFKISRQRSVLWWLLAVVFVAFLPNSAYVLTDIIHLLAAIKSPEVSRTYLLLVIVPFYLIYLIISFEFYVLSVQFAQQYINKLNISWLAKLFIPAITLLSALGVYLGRFQRLESTDILQQPLMVFKDTLLDLSHQSSALIIVGLFIGYYLLYYLVSHENKRWWRKFLLVHKGDLPK